MSYKKLIVTNLIDEFLDNFNNSISEEFYHKRYLKHRSEKFCEGFKHGSSTVFSITLRTKEMYQEKFVNNIATKKDLDDFHQIVCDQFIKQLKYYADSLLELNHQRYRYIFHEKNEYMCHHLSSVEESNNGFISVVTMAFIYWGDFCDQKRVKVLEIEENNKKELSGFGEIFYK